MTLLPMFFKGLTPELEKKAEVELNETPQIKAKALIEIRKIVKEQHRCVFEDEFLLRFLRVKKFNIKKAVKVLGNFLNFQRNHSGVFTQIKPTDLRNIVEMNAISFVPYRLPDFSHVAYLRLGNYNPSAASAEELVACIFSWNEIAFEYKITEIAGVHLILDLLDATFQQYKMFITLSFAKFLVSAFRDCNAIRFKAIHIINEPLAFYPLYIAFKSFGSKKLSERFHVHGSNLSSLHEHIPKDILPPVFGGTAEPMDNEELASLFYSYDDLIERFKARVQRAKI